MASTNLSSPSGTAPLSSASSIIDTSLLLCQCIESWQSSEPYESRDGKLDWEAIAQLMSTRTGKAVLIKDLQTVWKFIAYGKHFVRQGPEEVISYSDDEDPFYQPFSAVKRNRIYLQKDKDASTIITRNYLPTSVPDKLSAQVLGKDIKIDIPSHILKGSSGVAPALYVSSNELTSTMKPNGRNARISLLSAQENPSLSATLRKFEMPAVLTLQQQQMNAQAHALHLQKVAAAASASTAKALNLQNNATARLATAGAAPGAVGQKRPLTTSAPTSSGGTGTANKKTVAIPARVNNGAVILKNTNTSVAPNGGFNGSSSGGVPSVARLQAPPVIITRTLPSPPWQPTGNQPSGTLVTGAQVAAAASDGVAASVVAAAATSTNMVGNPINPHAGPTQVHLQVQLQVPPVPLLLPVPPVFSPASSVQAVKEMHTAALAAVIKKHTDQSKVFPSAGSSSK